MCCVIGLSKVKTIGHHCQKKQLVFRVIGNCIVLIPMFCSGYLYHPMYDICFEQMAVSKQQGILYTVVGNASYL